MYCGHLSMCVGIKWVDIDLIKQSAKSYLSVDNCIIRNNHHHYTPTTSIPVKPVPDESDQGTAHWNCNECGTSLSPWLCLMCGLVHCGRYVNQDGLKHYNRNPQHAVSMDCISFSLFCYICDDFVYESDALKDRIDTIRESLMFYNRIRRGDHCYQRAEYLPSTGGPKNLVDFMNGGGDVETDEDEHVDVDDHASFPPASITLNNMTVPSSSIPAIIPTPINGMTIITNQPPPPVTVSSLRRPRIMSDNIIVYSSSKVGMDGRLLHPIIPSTVHKPVCGVKRLSDSSLSISRKPKPPSTSVLTVNGTTILVSGTLSGMKRDETVSSENQFHAAVSNQLTNSNSSSASSAGSSSSSASSTSHLSSTSSAQTPTTNPTIPSVPNGSEPAMTSSEEALVGTNKKVVAVRRPPPARRSKGGRGKRRRRGGWNQGNSQSCPSALSAAAAVSTTTESLADSDAGKQSQPHLQSHPSWNSNAAACDTSPSSSPASSTSIQSAGPKRPKKSEPVTVRGLRNLGNTCFMNAVLQSLSNITDFSENILKIPTISSDEKGGGNLMPKSSPIRTRRSNIEKVYLADELRKTLVALEEEGTGAISPDPLFSVVWKLVPRFRGFQQQDAHEFLRCVLERLGVELSGLGGAEQSESLVTAIFQGLLQSQVTCLHCSNSSWKQDPFLDLSLDLPVEPRSSKKEDVTLGRCLSHFFDKEELDSNEQYMCTSCDRHQPSTKQFFLKTLPNVLCLHLKRFRWQGGRQKQKLDHFVEFPGEKSLDLTSFVLPSKGRKKTSNRAEYNLGAVVVHHGSGAGSGHYTAYALRRDSLWYHFNDSSVRATSLDVVSQQKAYLLFYVRKKT